MRSAWLLLLLLVVAVGCGDAKRSAPSAKAPAKDTAAGEARQPSSAAALPGTAERRKIIYRATVELVVEEFEPVQARVDALIKRFNAYLAKSTVSGKPGAPRGGHWTVRVPVEGYDDFLAAAREIGEVRRISSDSQDVTEEYVDVEARIRNKKQEETRLKELLDKATGKLEEVLAVEKEITRVRGEIEQAEGRMRVLADLTTLATVELQIDEIKDYVPEEGASYATRVRRAFEKSVAALVSTAKDVSIAAVAAAPWLGVLLVLGLPPLLWVRRRRKRKPQQPRSRDSQ